LFLLAVDQLAIDRAVYFVVSLMNIFGSVLLLNILFSILNTKSVINNCCLQVNKKPGKEREDLLNEDEPNVGLWDSISR